MMVLWESIQDVIQAQAWLLHIVHSDPCVQPKVYLLYGRARVSKQVFKPAPKHVCHTSTDLCILNMHDQGS